MAARLLVMNSSADLNHGSSRREKAHYSSMPLFAPDKTEPPDVGCYRMTGVLKPVPSRIYAIGFGERARLGRCQPAPSPVGPATEQSLNSEPIGVLETGWRGANHGARGGRAPLFAESQQLGN